jgi:D-cysteine desulfhydrase
MKITYPKRIELAHAPTPLQKLERIGKKYGIDLYIKRDDLTGIELTGNKVRKLEFLLAEALELGADTIITCGGIESNHCRSTAAACARLGLKCHLILRVESEIPDPDGNFLMDYLFGAAFSFVPAEEYWRKVKDDFPEIQDKLKSEGKIPYFIPVGGSSPTGTWGYIAVFEELKDQLKEFGISEARIVTADGSGGTHSGLVLGALLSGEKGFKIYGVNIIFDEEYFINYNIRVFNETVEKYNLPFKADRDTFNILDGYVGPGYGISYPECMETIRMVAREEGLILDPVYTGKAFHAMLSEIKKGKFPKDRPILFIHTGGIFGIFPHRKQFRITSNSFY